MIKVLLSLALKIFSYACKLFKSTAEKHLYWYGVMQRFGLLELKTDFDSVYITTLYRLIKEDDKPKEIVKLFEIKEVKNAFKEKLYNGNDSAFLINVDAELHTNPRLKKLKTFDLDLSKEIEDFKNKFVNVVNETRVPKELESRKDLSVIHNKLNLIHDHTSARNFLEDLNVPNHLRSEKLTGQALEFLKKLRQDKFDRGADIFKYKLIICQGCCYLDMLDNKEAGEYFVEALQYNPNDETANTFASLGYFLLDDKEKSKACALKAIEKNPYNAMAYSNLINIWHGELSLEEIEKKIPQPVIEKPDITYQFGRLYFKEGKLPQAKTWYERALKHANGNQDEIKGALGSIIVQLNTNIFNYVTDQLDQAVLSEIKRGKALLEEAWHNVENTDLKKSRVYWLVNMGVAEKLLNDPENTLFHLRKAAEIAQDDLYVQRHLLIAYYENRNFERAQEMLQVCKQLSTEDDKPDVLLLEAQICYQRKEWESCLQLIDNILETADKSFHGYEHAYFLKINVYDSLGEYDQVIALCDQLLNQDRFIVRTHLIKSRVYKKLGDFELFSENLNQAIEKSNKDTPFEEIHDLISILTEEERYKDAVQFLTRITNTNIYSRLTRLLISGYLQAGKTDEALKLIEKLKPNYRREASLVDAEFVIRYNIHDYDGAKNVCLEYLEHQQSDPLILLRLAAIYAHENDQSKLKQTIEKINNYEQLSLDLKAQLADYNIQIGKPLVAIPILYNLRRNHYSNGWAHLVYFQLYNKLNKELTNPWLKKEHVDYDCTVTLINLDSQQIERMTLLNESEVRAERNELGTRNILTEKLLGRKVNDIVEDASGTQYRIKEIVGKYVGAIRESIELLSTKFKELSGFRAFTLNRSPGQAPNLERDFAPIFDMLDKDQSFKEELESQYNRGLPAGTFASFSKKNPMRVWGYLTGRKDLGIHQFGGTQEHNFAVIQIISGKTVVLDPFAVLTAYRVCPVELLKLDNERLIPQSFMDELKSLIDELKDAALSGDHDNLFKQGGQYFRQSIPLEQTQKNIEYYELLKKWLENNFSIVPNYDEIDLTKEKKDKLDEIHGEAFIDAAYIARNKGFLVADDATFRSLMKSELDVDSSGVYSILISLLEKNIIDEDVLNSMLFKLAQLNYKFIPPSGNLLFYALAETQFQLKHPLTELLDSLGKEVFNLKSSMNVLVHFLRKTYLETNELVFNKIVEYVIRVVMKRKNYQAKMLFFAHVEARFGLLVKQKEYIYSLWNSYENF